MCSELCYTCEKCLKEIRRMEDIRYISTRGCEGSVTASQAILKGIAEDGGLYVPATLPVPNWDFDELKKLDYRSLAYEVLKQFLTDYTEEELKNCINKAYDEKFDAKEIVPMKKAGDAYYLELWHGATAAFKDMALSMLPHLMVTAAKKNNLKDDIVILTATSGDTGKAALAGFADVPGTKIIVFYPKDGVSTVQERQMVTQEGDNTCVIAVKGNFDDAQTGVKKLFTDQALAKKLADNGYCFSSANSINIGRLTPQVVYYVWAYCRLLAEGAVKKGEAINVVVPTGNFGNILAAYYAKCIGLPINKLICASNENKVLYDFFASGTYDRKREFILTTSPSMDILISSNLERLIYKIAGDDAKKNAELMAALTKEGSYTITDEMKEKLADFVGGYASEAACADAIHNIFASEKYCIDTHTAVAAAVYNNYRKESGDDTVAVIASTASPYKFTGSVLAALEPKDRSGIGDFELVDELNRLSGVKIPATIGAVRNAPIRHNTVCEISEMQAEVEKYLKLR